MRLGIKGKQVLGVTSIVAAVVVVLSLLHVANLAHLSLEESKARAELLADAIYHRAHQVDIGRGDPYLALRSDPGLRSILESSLYSKNVTYAAVADLHDIAVAHADRSQEGQPLPSSEDLNALLAKRSLAQLFEIYRGQGRNYVYTQRLLVVPGNLELGSIRIGVSTLLIRNDLDASLSPAMATALIALAVAVFVAMLLAQLLLKPIHVIRSGLTRLGRGEFGVRLDLDQADEFGELGAFFNAVSEQLSQDRSQMAGQVANLESAVEHLEDAVAIVNPAGELLFVNPAMRTLVPGAVVGASFNDLVAPDHPLRRMAEQTLLSRQSRGPTQATLPLAEPTDRLVMSHAVTDRNGGLVGVMLVVRNLEYLTQVQSTIRYSRKLAALGRLSAGVAHEVKNPLNAMMIHLELLRQQFTGRGASAHAATGTGGRSGAVTVAAVADPDQAVEHVNIIANEIRRLDAVVQGFLKFSRPEDLKLQPVALKALLDEVLPVVHPEADRRGVTVAIECDRVPDVNGDPGMLRQAFLNLALNAVQAMPNGGSLRVVCGGASGRRVSVSFVDSGVGIAPEHLQRIFDLYFTTKEKGSGIGLSMVYRTVQMHDGEIEVESTPGAGTTFRILLPQA